MSVPSWQVSHSKPILSPSLTNSSNSATVWLLDGRKVNEAALAASLSWLNTDEQRRYARFIRPERQRQFLLGRWLLRQLLAESLELAPQQIVLRERLHNAPLLVLDTNAPPPNFNLSHSGPWVACALSMHSALGLDIERLDGERDFAALAEQIFDSTELASFRALPEAEKMLSFYQAWSSKEARYKLGANSGSAQAAQQFQLSHPALSIVLCSALPLAMPPLIIVPQWAG
ncbi:4'-phosphopantetheinyl transferase family protein [Undibacterium sp. Ren11W]|uniref:4'-phosphopantetheinyl transferase family protein n=1 Tax=Undibacterium sp. Ren11W TaxID=3413045 RepID=UPI003BEFAFC0